MVLPLPSGLIRTPGGASYPQAGPSKTTRSRAHFACTDLPEMLRGQVLVAYTDEREIPPQSYE